MYKSACPQPECSFPAEVSCLNILHQVFQQKWCLQIGWTFFQVDFQVVVENHKESQQDLQKYEQNFQGHGVTGFPELYFHTTDMTMWCI